jgi:hypothetical protein
VNSVQQSTVSIKLGRREYIVIYYIYINGQMNVLIFLILIEQMKRTSFPYFILFVKNVLIFKILTETY